MNLNKFRILRQPHQLFLVVSLVFGTILCFLTPPLQVPDEFAHFTRAYQLAQGQLISTHKPELGNGLGSVGGNIPLSMTRLEAKFPPVMKDSDQKVTISSFIESTKESLEPEKSAFTSITGFNYSPVPYLGSIAASFIGQLTNMSPILILYFGRILNMFVAITLIYFAIKKTPIFKSIFVLLALMPMTLYQLASLSADSIGMGIGFLTVAMIFYFAYSKEIKRIGRKEVLILIALFAGMALWKQPYAAFALLYFVIPREKVGSWQKYIVVGIGVIMSALLPMILWSVANAPIINAATVPANQLGNILRNPLGFAKVLFATYFGELGLGYFKQAIGVLGWLNVPISFLFHTLPYFILIVLTYLYENRQTMFRLSDRLVFLLTSLGVSGLLSLSLFLIWTPPGSAAIEGLQGRYFIPIIPLLIPLVSTRKISLNVHLRRPKVLFGLALLISCSLVVFRLITFYYL